MIIQGHRGCRGILPENTIASFIKAIELGVDGIELDVVVTKDKKLLVSHEPWMGSHICLTPEGKEISKEDEKSYNIYKMTHDEITPFDCGSKKHDLFPQQKLSKNSKPLFSQLIEQTTHLVKPDFVYNIEIKSEEEWYGTFQPNISEYATIITNEIQPLIKQNISFILQSFDPNIINELHKLEPTLTYGLLVENTKSPIEELNRLNFTPTYLNPEHILLSHELVSQATELGIKIITWTVNEKEDFEKCKDLGIHGVITDYPGLYV